MKVPPNFSVLFEDADLLAVDKPAGISVHNNEDPSNLLKQLQSKYGSLFPVHRLDKETSGIQLLAKNEKAASVYAQEFQSKSVKKFYVGIIKGQLDEPRGTWRADLTDKAEGRNNPAGSRRDQIPCETRYEVLEANQYFSLVRFHLITGRQHQIRKHCALVNRPLIGDGRYGNPKYNEKMASIYKTDRMFLHCEDLEIKKHRIVSPMPLEFAQILKA